jgi:hypothetical protein
MTKSKEQSTDVAVKDEGALMDPAMGGLFDLRENMEGVAPEFPIIKIIHAGQMFEMPDESKTEDFLGVIIDASRANVWWEESFDSAGGGNIPDCFSLDGIVPSHESEKKQNDDCATCPQNQFGSDPDGGRGKWCKNTKRVFVVVEGENFPFRLTVSPANLKGIDRYITMLSSKGVPYQLAKTRFTLEKATNKDNIEYSHIVYTMEEKIESIEEARRIKQLVIDLKDSMRGTVVKQADVAE